MLRTKEVVINFVLSLRHSVLITRSRTKLQNCRVRGEREIPGTGAPKSGKNVKKAVFQEQTRVQSDV